MILIHCTSEKEHDNISYRITLTLILNSKKSIFEIKKEESTQYAVKTVK